MKFYDTISKKNKLFKPGNSPRVSLYSCGPTVYNFVHLGNLRAYVFVDLLKRYLRYRGYSVKHVMNITDVDDKTIAGSREDKKNLKEFTDFYLKAFLNDLKDLNIQMPDVLPRATDYVDDMAKIIKRLIKKDFAYKTKDGSVYFRIAKFKNYGRLADLKSRMRKQTGEHSNLVDNYNKEDAFDFALWKAWRPQDGKVFWETELGKGRPGWHIECSAMAMKLLGSTIDIHCGGVDLIFPHHTNEIAQSEAATGKKFVRYFLHNEHLLVEGEKMSKSLGNFYTLADILKKGYHPLFLRLILLKTHYRQTLNFSFKEFEEAENILAKIDDFMSELDFIIKNHGRGAMAQTKQRLTNIEKLIGDCRRKFKQSLDSDLNVSEALAVFFEFINAANKALSFLDSREAIEIKRFIFEIDSVLGLIEKFYAENKEKLKERLKNPELKKLLKERELARKNRDYPLADGLRRKILDYGVIVRDKTDGYLLKIKI